MKINSLAITGAALLLISVLESCKGPAGDVGPQGAAGATGSAGAAGAKGDPGNANVVYSDWKTPTWDAPVYDYTAGYGFIQLSMATTANPLLTKDAINTAAIYTYIKYSALLYDNTAKTYSVVERITGDGTASSYFKIPGRPTANYEDFSSTYINCTNMGENFFSPYAYLYAATYNSTTQKYTPIPELTGKITDFYKNLVKSTPQIRQVIVYGNVKGGRLAAIDWKNYDEVKQALNLKD